MEALGWIGVGVVIACLGIFIVWAWGHPAHEPLRHWRRQRMIARRLHEPLPSARLSRVDTTV